MLCDVHSGLLVLQGAVMAWRPWRWGIPREENHLPKWTLQEEPPLEPQPD